MPDMPALDDDFALLTRAVRDAGRLALSHFRTKVKSWRKADGSLVSEADYASNALLERQLAGARPDYGWLSEESGDTAARLSASRVWIIDPVDGTQAFLGNQTDWCVSAALIEDERPRLAAVYNPAREEFFAARAGGGAMLNGEALRLRDPGKLEGARIIGSQSLLAPKNWREPLPAVELVWANSIAYRICLVAAGRADATFAFSQKWEWDVAAAALIAAEAGCAVTGEHGQPLVFNNPKPRVDGLFVAPPVLHRLLLERSKSAGQGNLFHATGE
jgi:myo-inositol-1(or 4)-monophosphatase